MTEAELNYYLKISRTLADKYYKAGQKELGDHILRFGSEYAQIMLKLHKLNGKVICRQCKKRSYIAEERDYIRAYGVCLGCDAVYSALLAEQEDEQELYN